MFLFFIWTLSTLPLFLRVKEIRSFFSALMPFFSAASKQPFNLIFCCSSLFLTIFLRLSLGAARLCPLSHRTGAGPVALDFSFLGVAMAVGVLFALTALVIRMNDKVNRLKNIIVKHRGENAVEDETYLDAFKDLSVYGIIAQLVSERVWGK